MKLKNTTYDEARKKTINYLTGVRNIFDDFSTKEKIAKALDRAIVEDKEIIKEIRLMKKELLDSQIK